jgi:hypothetical protein
VAKRKMIAVPARALATRSGVDYVRLVLPAGEAEVPVIAGENFEQGGERFVEILTGLSDGDRVVVP